MKSIFTDKNRMPSASKKIIFQYFFLSLFIRIPENIIYGKKD